MNLRLLPCNLKCFNLRQTVTANRICFRTVYTYPITFEHVVFPPSGQLKLPTLPPEPTYDENLEEEKYKTTKRFIDARGPESIHTELIHKQTLLGFSKK
uniref:Uncharacterized protein n=1 Tax=Globodera rostochiensis TaxID=31243 RepID=A0A914HW41_GLORO